MANDREKAFEISNDGLLLEDGVHISSGTANPSHSGNAGDVYFKTDGTKWINQGGSTWAQDVSSFDVDRILVNQLFDTLADQNGNLLVKEA